MRRNDGSRFERLPRIESVREVRGRPTRETVMAYFAHRFGIQPAVFNAYTFWEKGAGKIWAVRGTNPEPLSVQAYGLPILRTRQRYWKPTTDGVQAFGRYADRNVVTVDRAAARAFWAGESIEAPMGCDPGYVIVAHTLANHTEPLGIGLTFGEEIRSMVPKGRRRAL